MYAVMISPGSCARLASFRMCSVVVVAGDFNCSYNAIDSAYALDDPVSRQPL